MKRKGGQWRRIIRHTDKKRKERSYEDETQCTTITNKSDLFRLGMKSGTLNDPKEEHWYTVDLKAGTRYFVDIRNVGKTNCYIELSYILNGETKYFYTTNPERKEVYHLKPEK